MRIRYLLVIFAGLSWLWLAVYGAHPSGDGSDRRRALRTADTREVPAGDVDFENLQVEPKGLPRDRARRLYERVVEEVRRGDCEAALPGFEMFVALHGDSELVPYAEYWAGECAFRLGRYAVALEAFDRVVSHSPLDPKLAAGAFMKKGLVYERLGELGRARRLLELVVVQFPNSRQATEARQALLVR